jgi:prophage antirepressor-like protein
MVKEITPADKLKIFENKKVRTHWDKEKQEWFFSVVDVCGVLSDSAIPRNYWSDLKRKLKEEGSELHEKIVQLKMLAEDNKMRETDALDTKGIFRLVQSIPSPKAEPFKLWLAQMGSERLDELADPEIAINRAIMTYKKKGYSDKWIERRLASKELHDLLEREWYEHGIDQPLEFAVLTDTILKTWSGKTTKEYKEYKDLKKENLRDNMTQMELLLTMLSEETTKELVKQHNPQGLAQNKNIAEQGGEVAFVARKQYEKSLGRSMVSPLNSKNIKQIKDKKDGEEN